jgi:glycosyltransferase involved in cell wall biosynthesis
MTVERRSEARNGRRIRVLRIIARMNLGGPAYHVSLLSALLDPSRYHTLLVAGGIGQGEASADEVARHYGADLVSVAAMRPELRPKADLAALHQLVKLTRRFRPDIVHTHTAKAGFIGRLAAAYSIRPRPAIVHTYHGHVLEGYFSSHANRTYRRLEWLSANVSDALIGVSQATVDDLVRLGIAPRTKFRTIPLGLDLDPYLSADLTAGESFRREVGLAPDEVLVTFVGRLVPIKRVDLTLRAVAIARSRGAPLRLVVVGDGELRGDLERLAVALGLEDAVRFVGYRTEMWQIAVATDIALLTSGNEGTPVWLIEAAAAGRPAVATGVGGVPEVVCGGCGMIVPSGDEDAVAAALVRLAKDPQARRGLGEKAREHVRQRYPVQRLLDDIDELYQELVARL